MNKIAKHKNEIQLSDTEPEDILFSNVAQIIEKRKFNIISAANNQIVLMFWEIGRYINSAVLGMERAEYGKRIVSTLSTQLLQKYGNEYHLRNVRRMMQFATQFPDFEIVSSLGTQLSWTHIRELLPLKTMEEKFYYAEEVNRGFLGVRDLRHLIARKAFLRRNNANLQLTRQSKVPFNAFKDPVILDTLGLKDNYLEGDLEQAIFSVPMPTGRLLNLWNSTNRVLPLRSTGQNFRRKSSLKVRYRKLWQRQKNALNAEKCSALQMCKSK